MNNFEFYNPVRIIFGKNTILKLSKLISPDFKNILLVYGGGSIKSNGVYDQIMNALAQRNVIEFSGVEANPDFDTLMKAVSICREEKIDFILAAGGGSVIDGVKLIAAGAHFEGDPWDILAKRGKVKSALPFGTVLTLPATGSEMNSGSVVSRRALGAKLVFQSEHVFPVFSILDPETTRTLPVSQLANGIIDAFIHVCEQYITNDVSAVLQYHQSEAVLKTLIEIAETVMGGFDYDSRAAFMWAATNALNGTVGVGVPQDWATHVIGHELTALYGLDHAVTLAIVQPGVWQTCFEAKKAMLARYGRNVWNLSGDDTSVAHLAMEKTDEFYRSLGVLTTLSEHGVDTEKLPIVAEKFASYGYNPGENSDLTPEKITKLLNSRI
ncbi:iron-containing alcohol dehydrogenase [Myxococcota bacterium]|nr:iron-containing alcohol dehydrogenase [Myxococcota bacterium]MBU1379218.1 iron-containing alcohol dehydrogenase [Myxococcota bacterium]MBU1496283.1 iron-containing alcohol dehydrogenase [Myxococcota bacterium]